MPHLGNTDKILLRLLLLPLSALVSQSAVGQEGSTALTTPEEEAEFAELQAFFRGEAANTRPAEPEIPATWIWIGDFSVGAGYDDNPLLSDMPVSSVFVQPEAQVYGSRISPSPWKASILGYYQGRYFRRNNIDDEQLAFANAMIERKSHVWRLRGALDFLYARQVYDATALLTPEARESGVITQSRPKWSISARRYAKNRWYAEAYLGVSRSVFEEIDEDDWTFTGELRTGRAWRSGFELEIYAGFEHKRYLDAFSRTARGIRIEAHPLRVNRVLAGGEMEWEFGTDDQWELTLDFWAYLDEEADGLYYDRWRADIAPGVVWKPGQWEFAAEAGFQYTDYRSRRVSFSNQAAQWQKKWSGRFSTGYAWNRSWEAKLLCEYADLQSNRASIRYLRRAVTGVLTYSF